jgi:predicted kinase
MYSAGQRQRVYDEMLARAAAYLRDGRAVILDATHLTRASRDAVRALARDAAVPALAISVTAADDVIKSRLLARRPGPGEPSDAGWATYLEQKATFEPPAADEAGDMVAIDASLPLSEVLDVVERALALTAAT